MASPQKKVGIIGSGLIGRSWAMLFTGAGYSVAIYDVMPQQVATAITDISEQLHTLEKSGMLRGDDSARVQHSRISGASSVEQCVQGACFVQECVPEVLDLKKKVFKELDGLVGPDTVLSSSTSCIVPSKFTADLQHKANCIVSHPVNPPYFVPAVEVVPAPWTSTSTVQKTRAIMIEIGQSPVIFKKEIIGFGVNRLQYALLNECYHLVVDGILSAEDVDTLMADGLGARYAWMGPLETGHLNAEGWSNYLERYGPTLKEVSATLKGPADWTLPAAAPLVDQMMERIPVDALKERRAWRDERLVALAALRNEWRAKEKKD